MRPRPLGWMLALAWSAAPAAVQATCPEPAPEVEALLAAGDGRAAEARAMTQRDASPEQPSAHEALAGLYLRWAALSAGDEPAGPSLHRARASRALGVLQQVLDRWPERASAGLCRAQIYRELGMETAYLQAVAAAARALRGEGDAALDALLELPAADLAAGRAALAARAYERIAEVHGDSPAVLSNQAAALLQLGELEAAEAPLARARALAPAHPLILRNAATLAIYRHELDDAVDALRRYAEAFPQDARVLFELAAVELGRDPRGSLPAWEAYLARQAAQPDDAAWVDLARQVRDRLQHHMGEPELLAVAEALMAAGAPRYAVPLLGGLTRRVAEEPMYFFVLGLAYERCGLPAVARRPLERARELLEGEGVTAYGLSPAQVGYELGRLELARGDAARALDELERVERDDPATRNLQYLLGVAHAELGHAARARAYYEQCASRPNNAEYAELCRSRAPAPPPP